MNGFTTEDRVEVERGVVELHTGRLRGADDVKLSPMEVQLLAYLARRPGEVVAKDELLVEVWGYAPGSRSRTLFATIDRLRRKLERDPTTPRHVMTVGRQGYTFRPLGPTTAAATPVAPDAFVGRVAELAAVSAALEGGRVITLRGPGGTGKTRLARELLDRRGGLPTTWCALDETHTGPEVVAALADALQLPLGATTDLDRHLRRIARALTARPDHLLVLDNAEVVSTELSALLAGWPGPLPAVLVTSRVTLGLDEEHVISLDPLAPTDASALFVARAQQRRPGWTPSPDQVPAIDALVALLDGLPLAIELAARWSRLLEPSDVLDRLRQHRLPLQAGEDDDRPERHRSLEATLRWSWEALEGAQRAALEACSVFRGGFDADAAEAVLGGPDALQRLDELQHRSLLTLRDGRLGLLEAVRTFAESRLHEDADALDLTRRRHATHYAQLGRPEAVRALQRGERPYAEVARELPNLLAAVTHGTPEESGLAALAVAVTRRVVGPFAPVVPMLEVVLARPGVTPALQARLWTVLGGARRNTSDAQGAFDALNQALALAEAHAPEQLGEVHESLGIAAQHHGTPDEAARHLEAALEHYRAIDDAYGEAIGLAELAGMDLRAGRSEAAIPQYERSLRLLRRVGARHAEAIYLGNLGIAQMKRCRFEAGRRSMTASLELHRELGGDRYEGQMLCNLGLLHVLWGRPDEGVPFYEASLQAADRAGDRKDAGITHANLGWLQLKHGHTTNARRHLDAAEDVFDDLQMPLQQADVAIGRSWLCRVEGDLRGAERHLDRAAALVDAHGFGEHLPRVHAHRGLLAVARGDRAAGTAHLADARAAADALDLGDGTDGRRAIEDLRSALAAEG